MVLVRWAIEVTLFENKKATCVATYDLNFDGAAYVADLNLSESCQSASWTSNRFIRRP